MTRFATGMTQNLSVPAASRELSEQIEAQLVGTSPVAGALLFSTAAAGAQAAEVGRSLTHHWPEAEVFGTSFEGLLAGGRVWRDEPAIGLLAWRGAAESTMGSLDAAEPIPLLFEADEQSVEEVAHTLREAVGRDRLLPEDLLLLFPDALDSSDLEALLAGLFPANGAPAIAGAAASGIGGGPALVWAGGATHPGALLGLLVPGLPRAPGPSANGVTARPAQVRQRVASAGASRSASPWLEISACRSRWIDGLDGEPPVDWIRRQLALDPGQAIEPYLERLLARVRPGGGGPVAGIEATAATKGYDEQYLVGLDVRSGSICLPGRFRRGDELAFALPDADLARSELRAAVDRLAEAGPILQFACRARDETLHGDRDLESALVAHHASKRAVLGTLAPFQLGPCQVEPERDAEAILEVAAGGPCRRLVHATVLAALDEV